MCKVGASPLPHTVYHHLSVTICFWFNLFLVYDHLTLLSLCYKLPIPRSRSFSTNLPPLLSNIPACVRCPLCAFRPERRLRRCRKRRGLVSFKLFLRSSGHSGLSHFQLNSYGMNCNDVGFNLWFHLFIWTLSISDTGGGRRFLDVMPSSGIFAVWPVLDKDLTLL